MTLRIFFSALALFLGLLYALLFLVLNGAGPLQGIRSEELVLTMLKERGIPRQGLLEQKSPVRNFSSSSNNRPATSYHYRYSWNGADYTMIEIITDDLVTPELKRQEPGSKIMVLVSPENPHVFRLDNAIRERTASLAEGTGLIVIAQRAIGIMALLSLCAAVIVSFVRRTDKSR